VSRWATVTSGVWLVGTGAGRSTLLVLCALGIEGLVVTTVSVVRRLHAVEGLLLGVEVRLAGVHLRLVVHVLGHERLGVGHCGTAVSATESTTGRGSHGGAVLVHAALRRHVGRAALLVGERAVVLSRRVRVVAAGGETATTAVAGHKVTAHAGVAVL
jgi:hypothetical protein